MQKEIQIEDNNEMSLKDLFAKIKHWIFLLQKQFWKIVFAAIFGASIGYFYAYLTPTLYNAKLSFVVEEGKGANGGLASLAGQFGFDIGGGGGTSLLSGDNILMFLKSTSLTKESLLSTFDSSTNTSLADRYADVYGYREKWANSKKVGKKIYFPPNSNLPYTRLQDSLLGVIVKKVLKKEITVDRPEKKASFIIVQSSMKDEILSKLFCLLLVQKATDRYVQSKIKRQKINVERLQRRADSIALALNNKTYSNASYQEKILDINPTERTSLVNVEVSNRDKMMLATIYGEVVKNLEIAKIQLTQDTPTIQIVDSPELPLNSTIMSKLIWLFIGAISFILLSVVIIIIKNLLA